MSLRRGAIARYCRPARYCARYFPRNHIVVLMLPAANNEPSSGLQHFRSVEVARDVASDLILPPLRICLRRRSVLRTAMPEAAIYEQSYAGAHKHNVNAKPTPRDHSTINAKAQPSSMKRRSNFLFGFGVASANAFHARGNRSRRFHSRAISSRIRPISVFAFR